MSSPTDWSFDLDVDELADARALDPEDLAERLRATYRNESTEIEPITSGGGELAEQLTAVRELARSRSLRGPGTIHFRAGRPVDVSAHAPAGISAEDLAHHDRAVAAAADLEDALEADRQKRAALAAEAAAAAGGEAPPRSQAPRSHKKHG
jgi:hypothetical protein